MKIILEAIQQVFGVTIEELKSDRRGKKLSYARRIYFYYAMKRYPYYSQKKTGEMLNKKQSSVSGSIAVYERENSRRYNPEFREYVKRIDEYIDSIDVK